MLSVYSTINFSPITEYLGLNIRLSAFSSFCQCIFVVYTNTHFSYIVDMSMCVEKCIVSVPCVFSMV